MRFPDKPLEPVLDKVELLDDFRPEQCHEIARSTEMEAWKKLFGHRRPADHVSLFNHCDLFSFFGQIGGGD